MRNEFTDLQWAFIDQYFLCNLNGTEAADRAGYSGSRETLASIASENLRKPKIRAEIDRRLNEATMEAGEVLFRLNQHAQGIPHACFRVYGPTIGLDFEALRDAGLLHLIKKISYDTNGAPRVEVYDAQTALIQLGKYYSLFNDRFEDSAPSSEPARLLVSADLLAPSFLGVYDDVKEHKHTEYLLKGGRGSTKSSFVSLIIPWLLAGNDQMHALVMRQVKDTLRDSVYSQLLWALAELGIEDDFKCTVSPLEMTYRPTRQKIYFRGGDEPGKIKSIKPAFGYIGLLWFEELDQFRGPEAVRNIEQSAIRGGDGAYIFKSYNPPRSTASWANRYAQVTKTTQLQHHSTYLELGARQRWLGQTFIDEADHLKTVNPDAYEHEYLGIDNGTGGQVFANVELRALSDAEIAQFDRIHHGLDWGFSIDPAAYVRMHYDAARLTLYIFGEFRATRLSNRDLYDALVDRGLRPSDLVIADSAEPKSIADFVSFGQTCRGAEKGPDSVRYSIKWLQTLRKIVIDHTRAPFAAQEFVEYEYDRDKDGNVISHYPDRNNHHIDAARYGTNLIWRARGQ